MVIRSLVHNNHEGVEVDMVSEQQLLDFMQETAYKPMTYQELEGHFQIEDAAKFKQLLQLLNVLEQQGKIVRTRTNRYGVPERMNLVRGKLQAHAKGFAFLIPDNNELDDVYIHANDLKGAMNGDAVLVRLSGKLKPGSRLEGEVVRIFERANTEIVGLYQDMGSFGFVAADDTRIVQDIFVSKEQSLGAVDGHKVVVEIVKYPEKRAAAEGKVIEVLGHKNDPGVDILSIIRKYRLPEQFPAEVEQEVREVSDTIQEEELKGRRDLRDLPIVTIDGADAKDLDDAVYVEKLSNGHYRLGVHIADVGYYVKQGSALDREAYLRGCSVYLVDRVIPMLPPKLSNGICSLNPHVDRLTMSCTMEFDEQGNRLNHDIFPSVIRSAQRMTYEDMRKIIVDEDSEIMERYAEHVDDFKTMNELAQILRDKRKARGAIDFNFGEAKIIVDEDGKPTDIMKRERTDAEQLIEEFMLAANETVAEHFYWMKVPFLYRVHEDPTAEKLTTFAEFITNFGYVLRGIGNRIHPRSLQTLLDEIKGEKEETIISMMMLRSMKQARYDAESLGHFGLSAKFYSHFTSPIRRYPDLVIHRVIREVLFHGSYSEEKTKQLEEKMDEIAKQSSERERIAVDAERDTDKLKKAEYMMDKIGEEFDGIISGITGFGMFVELDNTVEGLVHISELSDDYYHYHERQMALIGERTARIYRVGDPVRVSVRQVNEEEHTIDFDLISSTDGDDQGFGNRMGARKLPPKSKKKNTRKGSTSGRNRQQQASKRQGQHNSIKKGKAKKARKK